MKKTILILLGMILLVGLTIAQVSLNPKESAYIKTYKIKDSEGNCINVIWELEDDLGFYNISLGHCNCENYPIMREVKNHYEGYGMDGKPISGDIITYEIIGYEDRCDDRYPQFQILYKQKQEDRRKSNIKITEGYNDKRLEDKIIDETGNVKDKE